ncbi:MAG: DUF5828 family protein [Candidatus Aenigmatarchaeota archaeon]
MSKSTVCNTDRKVCSTDPAKVEYTHAGVEFRGDWDEVCIFARSLETVMEENSSDEEAVEKYNKWRPREKEDEKDITKKTVEEASIEKKGVEDGYDGPKEELEKAGEKIKKGVAETVKIDDSDEGSSTEKIKRASKNIERLVGAESIRSIRKLEKLIYQGLMLRFNPCYFDTEEFSISFKKGNGGDGDAKAYVLAINISDDGLRDKVQKELEKITNT